MLTTLIVCLLAQADHPWRDPGTFSIVAFDEATGDLGIAVASRVLAVGAVVPWARAGVGAVATQSYANTTYGPKGLDMMDGGQTAEETLAALLDADPDRENRQVGVVDAQGGVANHTGSKCLVWAGARSGTGYTCQGNILAGEQVVAAMADAYEKTRGELADRLMAALAAGDAAGGDKRGRQSAAILVVRQGAGYAGFNDRYVDLRVDDHRDPVHELDRLVHLQLVNGIASRAAALHREGRTDEARETMRKGTERFPTAAALWYDLACYSALSGRKADALGAVAKAFWLDPSLRTLAKEDHDLDALREDPVFQALVEGL